VHLASHFPSQSPAHVAEEPAGVATPSHVPEHLPAHVPLQSIDGALALTSHVPEHCAEQVPVQFTTGAVTEPSHVAPALQVPAHCTSRSPGLQRAVTLMLPGLQLAETLQLASHFACTSALT
jgi:hypothetical protein